MSGKNYKSDVLVIGGGIAGIITALELLELGKKVVLLERDVPEKFGGLAKESFGGVFFVNTPEQKRLGIKDSPELAYQDWEATAEWDEHETWPRKWAAEYCERCLPDVYEWLAGRKVRVFPIVQWAERGLFGPGNSVPRFHMIWGIGYWLANAMIDQLTNHKNKDNLQVLFHHHVTEILTSNGAASGATGKILDTGEEFRAEAEVVVAASGGITGDLERVRSNWHPDFGSEPPPPEMMLNGSHPLANGEVHDLVEGLGGNITNLNRQWNYPSGVKHPYPRHENHGLTIVPPKSGLWMNYEGRRIGPVPLITAYDTRYILEQIYKQKKKYSWQVFNWKIANKEMAIQGSEFNQAIRDKKLFAFLKAVLKGNPVLVKQFMKDCEDFVTADNLPDLVAGMNKVAGTNDIDGAGMEADIKKYDANLDRGEKFHNDDQIRRIHHARMYRGDRVHTWKDQKILDPKAGPLIAVRYRMLTRKSLGGIQTDIESRVLNKSGSPVSGLYAVGEAAGFGGGGIHGVGTLEGTFLGNCVLTARIAAASIGKS